MERSRAGRLENVLADFAERYATREQLRALSVTTTSRDGVVEVTLSARGRPTRVRFVDRRFREMPAAQLADSVLEALATGRAEIAARAAAVTAAAHLLPALPAQPGPRSEPAGSRPQEPLWGRGSPPRTLLPPEPHGAAPQTHLSACSEPVDQDAS
ncbi:YbaB/EbfC family nucleoid-associated protein [Streptomyces sp. NPDC005483]|uniref:YbaB/EbfC family nucleoid-associated protein n=1 Tax=Streptomyces sp. NPDC005483 TaxID=3154882 RepID=UPI0033A614C3